MYTTFKLNTVSMFLEKEQFRGEGEGHLPLDLIYLKYVNFCYENNFIPDSYSQLKNHMIRMGFMIMRESHHKVIKEPIDFEPVDF